MNRLTLVTMLYASHIAFSSAKTCDQFWGYPHTKGAVMCTSGSSSCGSASTCTGGGMVYYSSPLALSWNTEELYDDESVKCCDDEFGCNPVGLRECWIDRYPNPRPTPNPTPSPTPSPTPAPSRSPSLSPTPSPTPSPTDSPTTASPTRPPVPGCEWSYTKYVKTCHPEEQNLHLIVNGDGTGEAECTVGTSTNSVYGNGTAIGVMCCEEDPNGVLQSFRPGCESGVTFSKAEAICRDDNRRLCTANDVLVLVPEERQDCPGDNLVWTSDLCAESVPEESEPEESEPVATPTFEHIGCYVDTSTRALPFGPSSVEALDHDGNPESGCNCLPECHGDCDSDRDCIGNLLCYHRHSWEDGAPPGCSGDLRATGGSNSDYCYDPTKAYRDDGWVPETCQAACFGYQYFSLQVGGQCFCGKSFDDATQYGQSSVCPASGLGSGWANDLYENLLYTNLVSGASAAKRITAATDEATNLGDVAKNAVVVIDLSTWMGVGVALALAILSTLGLWMVCSKICAGNVRTKQYAQVHVDSEDFADTEAEAINVE